MFKTNHFFKAIATTAVLFLLSGTVVSAQDIDDEVENLLEQEEEKSALPSQINPELQKNFIILESLRVHELNPHLTSYSSDSQLLTGLFEGLFSYNPVTLEPQYAIAKDYKTSRDKKRLTFTLREDAYFSNGEKITASHVRESWLRLLATPDAPYASLLDVIRGAKDYREGRASEENVGIVAVSDTVLSVYLKSPANYLPRVLCHPSFSVVHNNPTVYSGAFVLEDQEPRIYVLRKNPFYWDCKNTYLEEITFVQSNDIEDNTFAYNSGLINWVTSGVSATKILDKSALQYNGMFATSYIFFKTSAKKKNGGQTLRNLKGDEIYPWDYQEFRLALMEAVPWDALRVNGLVKATTFVYPLNGYPIVEGYDYTDLIEAKAQMKAAREKYFIPEEVKIPLILECTEFSFTEEQIVAMADNFKEINVELIVKFKDFNDYITGVADSSSDLFNYSWIGDFADPLTFLSLFEGDSTLNDSGWKCPEYDELLRIAAEAVNQQERYTLLAKAETILLDSGIIIPIYHSVSFNVIDLTEVGGWSPNAFDIHPLKYLYRKAETVNLPNVVMVQ